MCRCRGRQGEFRFSYYITLFPPSLATKKTSCIYTVLTRRRDLCKLNLHVHFLSPDLGYLQGSREQWERRGRGGRGDDDGDEKVLRWSRDPMSIGPRKKWPQHDIPNRYLGGTQEAPKRHPGGTQAAPRRHPRLQRALGEEKLIEVCSQMQKLPSFVHFAKRF